MNWLCVTVKEGRLTHALPTNNFHGYQALSKYFAKMEFILSHLNEIKIKLRGYGEFNIIENMMKIIKSNFNNEIDRNDVSMLIIFCVYRYNAAQHHVLSRKH